MFLKGSCVTGLGPNAAMFEVGLLGSDWIMRLLISPMDFIIR
jgi:hypothetical protein